MFTISFLWPIIYITLPMVAPVLFLFSPFFIILFSISGPLYYLAAPGLGSLRSQCPVCPTTLPTLPTPINRPCHGAQFVWKVYFLIFLFFWVFFFFSFWLKFSTLTTQIDCSYHGVLFVWRYFSVICLFFLLLLFSLGFGWSSQLPKLQSIAHVMEHN